MAERDGRDLRVRVYSIGYDQALGVLCVACGGRPEMVLLPLLPGLPEGCRVLDVHADYMRRTFDFVVQHPSFDPVAPGQELPRVPGPLEVGAFWVRVSYEGRPGVAFKEFL